MTAITTAGNHAGSSNAVLDSLQAQPKAEKEKLGKNAFLELMDFESGRAAEFYRAAEAALPVSDRRALVAAEIMRAVYSRLLDKMHRDRWRVFDRRYSLGKLTKLWLVLHGWLGFN